MTANVTVANSPNSTGVPNPIPVRTTEDTNSKHIQHMLAAIPRGTTVTLGYTGSNLTTVTYTRGVDTWTYTLSYTGANLTQIVVT